ncbi:MAG: vWA domain-containing protein [Acidobacteriota bacterium]
MALRSFMVCSIVSCLLVSEEVGARPSLSFERRESPRRVLGSGTNRLEPSTLSLDASSCGCVSSTVTAEIAGGVFDRIDVLLSIDLTGSMTEERSNLVAGMVDIIESIDGVVSDAAFGLVSHRDHRNPDGYGKDCPYDEVYGRTFDYPFFLHQSITDDQDDIVAAVSSLPLAGGGADLPESYGRVLLEAQLDDGIGWRPDARRLLITLGDSVPHDCNVAACLGDVAEPLGFDLGRDGLPDTDDDLAILDLIDGLVAEDIVLVHFDSGADAPLLGGFTQAELWSCWAERTGGFVVTFFSDGTPTDPSVDLVEAMTSSVDVVARTCPELLLRAEGERASWLTVGPTHPDVTGPASREFEIELCVPESALPGTYEIPLLLECEGAMLATGSVVATVSGEADEAEPCCGSSCFAEDFEGFAVGEALTTQLAGVTVSGSAPLLVFDTRAPTCDDEDLATPGFGNAADLGLALIIQETSSDCAPDDEGGGGVMSFVFDAPREIGGLWLIDIDEGGGRLSAWSEEDVLLDSRAVPAGPDNAVQELRLDLCGVRRLELELVGSGALGAIECGEGVSPFDSRRRSERR